MPRRRDFSPCDGRWDARRIAVYRPIDAMVICRRNSAESGNAFPSEDGDAHELVPGRLRGGSARSGRLCRTRVTKRYPSVAADAAGVRTFGYPRRVLPPERVLVDRGRRRPQLHNLWEPGGMLVGVVRVESSAEARKRVVGVLA